MKVKKGIAVLLGLVFLILCIGNAAASGIREMIRFIDSGQPVSYEIRFSFLKLPQFDEIRTEQLNRLLRHLSFSGTLEDRESTLTVFLDGGELFSLSETEMDGSKFTVLRADPEPALIIPGQDPETEAGFSSERAEEIAYSLELYSVLEDYAAFFTGLPEWYPGNGGSSDILEKYKDYGTAVRRARLSFTAEEWADCVSRYAPPTPDRNRIPGLRDLIYAGKQDVELLLTEEGTLLKVRYGGQAGLSEEDLRTVRLEWKTVRNETVGRDELSLRTPDSNAAKRNNLLLDHTWRKAEDGSETFLWKEEQDLVADGIRTRIFTECSLAAAEGTITGSMSRSVNVKNRNTVREYALSASEGSGVDYMGVLEIINKKDKIETDRLKVDFSLTSPVAVPAEDLIPEPAAVSSEDFAVIREKLVSQILGRLMSLPPEDLVFLTEGIPDEALDTILPDYRQ